MPRITNWRTFGVAREMYFNTLFRSGLCLARCSFSNFYHKWRFLSLSFLFKLGGGGLVKGYLLHFNLFYLMLINSINTNSWNCYLSWSFCVRFHFVMSTNVKGVTWWFTSLVPRLSTEHSNNAVSPTWYVTFRLVGLKEGGMTAALW